MVVTLPHIYRAPATVTASFINQAFAHSEQIVDSPFLSAAHWPLIGRLIQPAWIEPFILHVAFLCIVQLCCTEFDFKAQ